jgi:nucleoside-diphosphate kinase
MSLERTLAIIKPDAVAAHNIGRILSMIETAGFRILALRMQHLTRKEAEGFYAVHKGRGFYEELVTFMTEGPVVLAALERDDAVKAWRVLMGDTDSTKAADDTVRKKYGTDKGRNAAHGSDSVANGRLEVAYFFRESELN